MLGKTFVVVSEAGIACVVIKLNTQRDLDLLERILQLPVTIYERPEVKVRFNYANRPAVLPASSDLPRRSGKVLTASATAGSPVGIRQAD